MEAVVIGADVVVAEADVVVVEASVVVVVLAAPAQPTTKTRRAGRSLHIDER